MKQPSEAEKILITRALDISERAATIRPGREFRDQVLKAVHYIDAAQDLAEARGAKLPEPTRLLRLELLSNT